jgi:hypothetical protein
MRIKGAMTVLNKRAEFYGMTFDELIEWLDNRNDETIKVLEAYEIYKRDQGYVWCGVNGVGWCTKEQQKEEMNIYYHGGHQLELV